MHSDSSADQDEPFFMRRVSLRLDALQEERDPESDTSGDSDGEAEDQVWDDDSDGVLDPEGESVYIWMGVVSCCVLYNTWVIILRTAFQQMRSESYWSSYFDVLDMVVDLVYLADIAVHFRTGYLDDGILVTDLTSLSRHYRSQWEFRWDLVSMLPVKVLTSFLPGMVRQAFDEICCCITVGDGVLPILRLPRLLKWGTVLDFFQFTDSRTSRPNIVRALVLILYLASFIHWIACLYYMLSEEYTFTGLTFLIGVFLFATVVGNVGDVISSLRHARTEFQARLDRVKMYLNHHDVPDVLQNRVKRWADYSWNRTQAMDDSTFLEMLPRRLRKEIAVHVHLGTLRKVKIFEDCENGLLCDLALKLRSQVYTPGDYVCKSGEIGREMYIISHGKLKVYVQDSDTDQPLEVATLKEGNYFGEISLLKLDDGCNRRSADVVSVGYSELLCLSKKDLIHTLVEYPEARKVLEDQGRDRMEAIKESRMQRRRSDASSQSDSTCLKFPPRRTTSLPTRSSSGANKSKISSCLVEYLN
ncbi:CNGA1 [Branchiostoma lanceolatum]|uniref:CNGA1 protein n=1 Tax=Branchiostoma lanceolatum TaxID=7740 RepID=A0A8K0EUH2_BRALA|nr:CNGA1 [Branchiostoma lanceolatum]